MRAVRGFHSVVLRYNLAGTLAQIAFAVAAVVLLIAGRRRGLRGDARRVANENTSAARTQGVG
jgi:hypothetical protein